MGYDHAEQMEIEPINESSSSGIGTNSFTEAPTDPEKKACADSIGNSLTRNRSQDTNEHHHGKRDHTLGKMTMRAADDDLPIDWWFASTAIPLIAATFAPMANLLSIAGLVVNWRNDIIEFNDPATQQSTSVGYQDPQWCFDLNVASLVCGFVGNLFLLFNFTKRVRYIIALPATMVLFFIASGILIGITVGMNIHAPPQKNQIYSQGYWYAVIAAVLYMFNSMILMVNMVGYFLGHYPQHFNLTDDQRNLILQTILFVVWLGFGARIFSNIEDWPYPDALYFCDVTILTIGFGDYSPKDALGRGLVFPYSIGGTIILGLIVSSIHKFAGELSKANLLRKRVENQRIKTLSRTVTISEEDEKKEWLEKGLEHLHGNRLSISSPLPNPKIQHRLAEMAEKEQQTEPQNKEKEGFKAKNDDKLAPPQFLNPSFRRDWTRNTLRWITTPVTIPIQRLKKMLSTRQKALVVREEKDRFDKMREIQHSAQKFKKWYALCTSITAFVTLWCIGAVVFWQCEKVTHGMTYFQALYFSYVSLLTIGYGDLSPKSNAGKPFFVVWSLIAVPTMTILITNMGDTVIASFSRGTSKLADFTVLPQQGMWHGLVQAHPWIYNCMSRCAKKKRIKKSLPVGPDLMKRVEIAPSFEQLASKNLTEGHMAHKLAHGIRRAADDLCHHPGKRYGYEEWVEFTRLIRFTKLDIDELDYDEDQEGIVKWDWLDEKSPMMSSQSESEWILDRLCESLLRLLKKHNLSNDPDVPWRGATLNEEENVDSKDASSSAKPKETTPRQERLQRATGADALLTIFTDEQRGSHKYTDDSPIWSARARASKKDQRRKSSNNERRGPFS